MSIVTRGKRRIWFDIKNTLQVSLAAKETGKPLVHPPESWYVAEQFKEDGSLPETHVSGKLDGRRVGLYPVRRHLSAYLQLDGAGDAQPHQLLALPPQRQPDFTLQRIPRFPHSLPQHRTADVDHVVRR